MAWTGKLQCKLGCTYAKLLCFVSCSYCVLLKRLEIVLIYVLYSLMVVRGDDASKYKNECGYCLNAFTCSKEHVE